MAMPLFGPLTVPTIIVGAIIFLIMTYFRKIDISANPQKINKAVGQSQLIDNEKPTTNKPQAKDEPTNNDACSMGTDCCQVQKEESKPSPCCQEERNGKTINIYYGTTTGNSKQFAQILQSDVVRSNSSLKANLTDLKTLEDPEETLSSDAGNSSALTVLIISTYTEGSPPEDAAWFYKWLEEAAKDFRVQHSLLQGLQYTVFGLGHSLYSDHFNTVAKSCDKYFHQLSGKRFHPLGMGDENVAGSKYGCMENDFAEWKKSLLARITKWVKEDEKACKGSVDLDKTSDLDYSDSADETGSEQEDEDDGLVDLEDIGNIMKKAQDGMNDKGPKEMITPILRQSLTKQGYKLIGSHSGVKICRWTKAMLRGRGGCYKHTFYGIESHRCMETTPSLACANKCVFCWRHHSNPVGTEWKWKMDEPDLIVNGALENHYKMIKQMKGVPGVLKEKLDEGMEVKHCALSLVGEPIMYPEINK